MHEVIGDMTNFMGPVAFEQETRFFFASIKARLKADTDYLLINMRRNEPAVHGFEPYADGLDAWAN